MDSLIKRMRCFFGAHNWMPCHMRYHFGWHHRVDVCSNPDCSEWREVKCKTCMRDKKY